MENWTKLKLFIRLQCNNHVCMLHYTEHQYSRYFSQNRYFRLSNYQRFLFTQMNFLYFNHCTILYSMSLLLFIVFSQKGGNK